MGGFSYYGIDAIYIMLVIPAILVAIISQVLVKSTFSKYSAVHSNISGAEAARHILLANGIYDVSVERVSGSLTDHYDPRSKVIRLSDAVYSSRHIAAVGVAAHEAGHAVQYSKGYAPIMVRSFILPVSQLGSQLSLPLLLIGLLFNFSFLIKLGVVFFCAALAFQVITLPVEFNASKRAIAAIRQDGILTSESDISGARKVLSAAAMTYIAALLVSLAQLIRLLMISNRRR